MLFSETTWPNVICKLYVHVNKIFVYDAGHMTKMATMPIYGKNPSKIFSRTSGPISMKHGMYHWGLLSIIICSNDDPGLTLTYFTARSNFVALAIL